MTTLSGLDAETLKLKCEAMRHESNVVIARAVAARARAEELRVRAQQGRRGVTMTRAAMAAWTEDA